MGFNINEFRTRGIRGGGARPSLFKVRFTAVPPGVPNATADFEFMCRSAQIPASIIEPINQPYFGRQIKLAGDRVFQPWTITVINDKDYRHRNMFEGWHNKINALISNRQDSDPDFLLDYKVTAEVLQFSREGPGDDSGVTRAYMFNGIFPIMVDAINLDWDATNQVETFDVTLEYDEWVPIIFDTGVQPFSGILAPDPAIGLGDSPNG